MGFHPDTTRSWYSRPLSRGLSLTVLVISMFATFSWAGNAVKIGSLLANPESYQSQTVRVIGIVSDKPRLKQVKSWMNNMNKCAQLFTVKDETGSIQASYEVKCSVVMNILRQRDGVTLQARFERTAAGAGLLNVVSVLAIVSH
jgi:hypothetical protein